VQFLDVLGKVDNWSINNEQLLISSGKNIVAKLKAVQRETN
jgi:hypothetical protein